MRLAKAPCCSHCCSTDGNGPPILGDRQGTQRRLRLFGTRLGTAVVDSWAGKDSERNELTAFKVHMKRRTDESSLLPSVGAATRRLSVDRERRPNKAYLLNLRRQDYWWNKKKEANTTHGCCCIGFPGVLSTPTQTHTRDYFSRNTTRQTCESPMQRCCDGETACVRSVIRRSDVVAAEAAEVAVAARVRARAAPQAIDTYYCGNHPDFEVEDSANLPRGLRRASKTVRSRFERRENEGGARPLMVE